MARISLGRVGVRYVLFNSFCQNVILGVPLVGKQTLSDIAPSYLRKKN